MNSRIAKLLLPLMAVLLLSEQALAEKVLGTCKVDVTGPHTFTIAGKIYEGKPPANTFESHASTRAWALAWAEEYRSLSTTLYDQKVKLANELLFVLMIHCASEKGRVQLAPYDGTAKAADYPSGPRTFRLVGSNMHDRKSGDVSAVLLSDEFTTGMIEPAEPGELRITQSDGEKLVATFSFKSKTSTVTGSVNFTRPKEIVK
jgi:hypothetical protein